MHESIVKGKSNHNLEYTNMLHLTSVNCLDLNDTLNYALLKNVKNMVKEDTK